MHDIDTFLNSIAFWHWLAFGAVLIALEIMSATSYLLWPGIAALLVGAVKLLWPEMDGTFALILFAIFSVVATWQWKRTPWSRADRESHPTLNERTTQYIGRRVTAAEDFVGGPRRRLRRRHALERPRAGQHAEGWRRTGDHRLRRRGVRGEGGVTDGSYFVCRSCRSFSARARLRRATSI